MVDYIMELLERSLENDANKTRAINNSRKNKKTIQERECNHSVLLDSAANSAYKILMM